MTHFKYALHLRITHFIYALLFLMTHFEYALHFLMTYFEHGSEGVRGWRWIFRLDYHCDWTLFCELQVHCAVFSEMPQWYSICWNFQPDVPEVHGCSSPRTSGRALLRSES
mmetsp:Transcript_21735/g.31870  ORF Transcript_21735/g.31870 Transcript_21735/m.31870 type:complete len:111 (-) Transcript_21735:279-611(-)